MCGEQVAASNGYPLTNRWHDKKDKSFPNALIGNPEKTD
jgi:hypothetical protein